MSPSSSNIVWARGFAVIYRVKQLVFTTFVLKLWGKYASYPTN